MVRVCVCVGYDDVYMSDPRGRRKDDFGGSNPAAKMYDHVLSDIPWAGRVAAQYHTVRASAPASVCHVWAWFMSLEPLEAVVSAIRAGHVRNVIRGATNMRA